MTCKVCEKIWKELTTAGFPRLPLFEFRTSRNSRLPLKYAESFQVSRGHWREICDVTDLTLTRHELKIQSAVAEMKRRGGASDHTRVTTEKYTNVALVVMAAESQAWRWVAWSSQSLFTQFKFQSWREMRWVSLFCQARRRPVATPTGSLRSPHTHTAHVSITSLGRQGIAAVAFGKLLPRFTWQTASAVTRHHRSPGTSWSHCNLQARLHQPVPASARRQHKHPVASVRPGPLIDWPAASVAVSVKLIPAPSSCAPSTPLSWAAAFAAPRIPRHAPQRRPRTPTAATRSKPGTNTAAGSRTSEPPAAAGTGLTSGGRRRN